MAVATLPFDTGFGIKSERRLALDHLALPSGARILLVTGPKTMGRPWPRLADMLPLLDERFDLALDVRPARAPFQFPSAYFHAVILHGVLDSVVNPCEVLRETARVLRDGGLVSIYGAFLPVGSPSSGWLAEEEDGARLSWLSPRSLEEILRRAGAPFTVDWQGDACPGSSLRMLELRKAARRA
jgi:hypothetical protein